MSARQSTQLSPEEIAALPHDDLGPLILALTWTLTAISLVFLALRIYCKSFLKGVALWWDDYVLVASWITLLVATALATRLVLLGFGKHNWDFPQKNLQEYMLVTLVEATILACSIVWSKTGFAITLLRITEGWVRIAVWVIIATINIISIVGVLVSWVRCTPLVKAWDLSVPRDQGSCWPFKPLLNVYSFAAVFSGVMDVVLALLPWPIIWKLQMKRQEKIGVAVAMSMGIFAGTTAFVKAAKIQIIDLEDLYSGVEGTLWGYIEGSFTITAASIPLLRVFIKNARSTGRYYTTGDSRRHNPTGQSESRHRSRPTALIPGDTQTNTVTITSRRLRGIPERQFVGDDASDKSILADERLAVPGRILQTSEVVVDYDDRKDKGSTNTEGYELDRLSR